MAWHRHVPSPEALSPTSSIHHPISSPYSIQRNTQRKARAGHAVGTTPELPCIKCWLSAVPRCRAAALRLLLEL